MSHTFVGGYMVHHRLYRVPDLLPKNEFIEYMYNVYGVKVTIEELPEGVHPSDAALMLESAATGFGEAIATQNIDNTPPPDSNVGG